MADVAVAGNLCYILCRFPLREGAGPVAGAAGGPRPGQDRRGPGRRGGAGRGLPGRYRGTAGTARPGRAGGVGPVVSRLVNTLAQTCRCTEGDPMARASARERAWALAGDTAPGAGGGPVIIDNQQWMPRAVRIAQALDRKSLALRGGLHGKKNCLRIQQAKSGSQELVDTLLAHHKGMG